jgi:hypothetical protein
MNLALNGSRLPYAFMEFRLTYKGPLPAANRKNPRAKEKNVIRTYLHPQLEELWNTHPALQWIENPEDVTSRKIPIWQRADIRSKLTIPTVRQEFVPLVSSHLNLYCKLKVLFLRPERPGWVIQESGDLDNRMKVLLDALRIPRSADEARGLKRIDPFFCLLENDNSLVAGVEIDTDQLLKPDQSTSSYVELIIQVSVKVTHLTWISMGFVGD